MKNSKNNILYIGDSEADYCVLCDRFKSSSCTLNRAINLKEGIEKILSNKFDVILLSNYLPDSDGELAIKAIKDINSNLPIIVITGAAEESQKESLLKAGAQDYLQKEDIESMRLFTVIENAILRVKVIEREVKIAEKYHEVIDDIKRGKIQTIVGTDTPSGSVRLIDSDLIEDNIRLIENLAKSNEDLEQFAYIISHDFQEPLRTIKTFLKMFIEEAGTLNEKQQEYVEYINGAINTLEIRIDGVLQVSRVRTKGKQFEDVSLQELVRSVELDLSALIKNNNAKVIIKDLPTVHGDTNQLKQLFQNLLGNAIKFHSDSKPVVKITAESDKKNWNISVEDNGIGIPENLTGRLFTMFKRLHTDKEYEGSGIGLAVCKKIAERHGGTITLKSTEGKGSTFTLSLPLIPKKELKIEDYSSLRINK